MFVILHNITEVKYTELYNYSFKKKSQNFYKFLHCKYKKKIKRTK